MRILAYLLILTFSACQLSKDEKNTIKSNEIYWDTWGIPHIYAKSQTDAYQMLGWSQMHNHGNLLLRLYGEARGKSNRYWKGDFKRDSILHHLGVVEMGAKIYEQTQPNEKQIIDAFVSGLNLYAQEHPEAIEERFKQLLPLQPEDVLSHMTRVLYYEFLIQGNLAKSSQWSSLGSNAWALSPKKTRDKNAMLLMNPHLPWHDFFTFFEAQITTPETNLYGATLVGIPVIAFGFNEYLGWTLTVNVLDNVDLYEVPIDGNQYLMDGTLHPFSIDTLRIQKRASDPIESVEIVRKTSAYGVVLHEKADRALILRYPNMDGSMNPVSQWMKMGKAKTIEAFQDALAVNTMPFCNVLYADQKGNILYHFGGHVPKKEGSWERWQEVVSTSQSRDVWKEYYSSSEVPSYTNPTSGWIQNANDPPYTSTIPPAIRPEEYPSHISPNHMSFRPQRSAQLLKNKSELSFEEFIDLKHDTKSSYALRIKDEIRVLKSQVQDSLTQRAVELIDQWDGSFEADSRAALFFVSLSRYLDPSTLFEKKWSFKAPLSTPSRLKNPSDVLQAFQKAAHYHMNQWGSFQRTYGEIYRVRVGEIEFPGNGGAGSLGLFRTMSYVPGNDQKFYAYHGDSFVCVTEFGSKVRAKALVAYGNATQSQSSHIGDQLHLFAQKQLREVWFYKDQHLKHLESHEIMDSLLQY